MFASVFFGALLLGAVSARSIDVVLDDEGNIYVPYMILEDQEEQLHQTLNRVRREEPKGVLIHNPDGTSVLNGKAPFAGNSDNIISAIGIPGGKPGNAVQSGFGVALDNVNGHGLSVTKQDLPFGERITGTGKFNIAHNDNHDLTANAFVASNRPSTSDFPNFNTYGSSVDYKFQDKHGASLGMSSTPYLGREDYSMAGKANIFKTDTSSLDFGAGFNRVRTPNYDSGFQPNFGFNYGIKW